MNDLIKVGELNTQEVMSSLQIAEITGKEHKNVLRDIDSLLEQGLDKLNFEQTSYVDKSNRSQRMYSLTKKGCLILASGYDALLREKIINRWEQLEEEKKLTFKVPTTLKEALLLAAEQLDVIEKQQTQLLEQAPKVEFYDDVVDSKDAIDMAQVAKVLNMGIGRNKLFQLLRDNNILDRKNQPYQNYVQAGYFRCVESSYMKPNGDTCVNIKTVVFQKGLNYISKLIKSTKTNG